MLQLSDSPANVSMTFHRATCVQNMHTLRLFNNTNWCIIRMLGTQAYEFSGALLRSTREFMRYVGHGMGFFETGEEGQHSAWIRTLFSLDLHQHVPSVAILAKHFLLMATPWDSCAWLCSTGSAGALPMAHPTGSNGPGQTSGSGGYLLRYLHSNQLVMIVSSVYGGYEGVHQLQTYGHARQCAGGP